MNKTNNPISSNSRPKRKKNRSKENTSKPSLYDLCNSHVIKAMLIFCCYDSKFYKIRGIVVANLPQELILNIS